MKYKEITDARQLPPARRWEYMQKYYGFARDFYGAEDIVVSDAEINERIGALKKQPVPSVRRVTELKNWKFKTDADDAGIRDGFFLCSKNEDGWGEVTLPHSFSDVPHDPVLFGRADYMFYARRDDNPIADIWRGDISAWYKTRLESEKVGPNPGKYFFLETSVDHTVAYLNIGSANLSSDVWVNDTPVSFDHLGPFPYKVEITEAMCNGASEFPVVAVRVQNTVSNMPHLFANGFQHCYFGDRFFGGRPRYDWPDRASGGLAGDMTITITNKHHIENVFIRTEKISQKTANVAFGLTLRNQFSHRVSGRVEIEISKWEDGSPVILKKFADVSSRPMDDNLHEVSVNIPAPELWTPNSPNLYLAHVMLFNADGVPIDDVYESFGVRTFTMMGPHFYLNGKKIILQGTHDIANYHNESLIWFSDELIVKDILLHKKMNANCSRWPSDSRMHQKRIADLCDQLGFMVTWGGYFEVWDIHPQAEMLATRDVGAMVKDLRNHPSVVIWEMGDETLQCANHFRRMRFFDLIYKLVHEADPTRPIVPSGYYSAVLFSFVAFNKDKDVDYETRAVRVAEDYELYDYPNAAWDVHMGNMKNLELLSLMLDGKKPLIFTEFGGCNALPDPQYTEKDYGGFHWNKTPFWNIEQEKSDLSVFGKNIRPEDWRETQAMSSAILCSMINGLRQYPDLVSALQFVCLLDYWTIYCGVADIHGNAKLSFHAAKNHLEDVFVSALHGAAQISNKEKIKVTASNYAKDIKDAVLTVEVSDIEKNTAKKFTFDNIFIEGNVALTEAAQFNIDALPGGLYTFVYTLCEPNGNQIHKTFEMAYIDDGGGFDDTSEAEEIKQF
ncbi:MAG: hypothetical protein FWE82_02620 [Defluviitaleaceae bacterium]|nr:hypothetical protein [Defluviitaleaceae bacterium]